MFRDREKAIRMCLARFDDETSTAFFSAYTKVDDSLNPAAKSEPASDSELPDTTN